MKKVLFILLFSVLVVGAGFIVYIKSNPPLVINSYTSIENNSTSRLIEIENKGIRELQLQNILVNDGLPDSAELVVSKNVPLQEETKLQSNPNITFHKLKQVKIFPIQYLNSGATGKLPQHYGIKINAPNIHKVMIQYKYLKIPFTLTVELKNVK